MRREREKEGKKRLGCTDVFEAKTKGGSAQYQIEATAHWLKAEKVFKNNNTFLFCFRFL